MKKKFPIRHALISSLLDIDIRGFRKIAHHLPRLLIPSPKEDCIMLTRYGFWLHIDPVKDKGVERSIYYTGTYEKGALALMKRILREGDVFVDVGANIGLMSVYAARLLGPSGQVLAFEPNPETAGILEENIRINRLTNIESIRYAVGKTPGRALIYDRWDSNRGSASLIKPANPAESHEIQVCTLSEYYKTGKRKTPRLIKFDIEGFELEALEGALDLLNSADPPVLMVECSQTRENTFGDTTDPLYEFLVGLSHYRIFKGRKDKSRVSKLVEVQKMNELPVHDNIYCLTEQHLSELSIS